MKKAIIFGASGAIGGQIAEDMAANGWSLVLHYSHNSEPVAKLIKKFVQDYPSQKFTTLQFDFLDSEIIDLSILGNLNAAIFAQGITDFNFLTEQDDETINRIMQINLVQPLKIVKNLESQLKSTDHSRIIFIGSVYGKVGSALESVYSATKGGLSAFVNAYAKEIAPKTTVNVISPGAVQTKMNDIFSKEEMHELTAEIPTHRLAQPADISYFVMSLLDDRADYLTGQTVYVDGGWLV